jgi:hypothetical protein
MKKIAVFVLMFVFFLCIGQSYGFERSFNVSFEPYLKGGGLSFKENGLKEGHKFFTALGAELKLKPSFFPKVESSLFLEGWKTSEPMDEDTELPRKGWELGGKVLYRLPSEGPVNLSLISKVGYQEWRRDEGAWNSFRFFYVAPKIKGDYKNFFAGAGLIIPFSGRADFGSRHAGKPGFELSAGFTLKKKISLEYFYQKIGFKSSECCDAFSVGKSGEKI